MRVASITLALFFSLLAEATDSQWNRFRGPNGSGVDSSSVLPVQWTESNLAWKTRIPGKGHGSPIIWGDRIFLLSADALPQETGKDEAGPGRGGAEQKGKARKKGKAKGQPALPYRWIAMAISREDGEILWEKSFNPRKFKGHRFNSPASSTAAADEDQVVFSWGTADELTLVSLSHDGDLQWERNMGPVVGGHGFGGSPIIHGDLVVLNNDQEKENGNLFALDAKTGDLVWTTPRRSQRISYSVPCVYRDKLVFVNWQHGFTAINPADGSVFAEKSVFNTETNERAISSPIVVGDRVIGTCGFTANPKHCVAMKLEGDEWKEIWRIERNVPHIPCVIATGDLVFLWDDSGIATCVRAASGEIVWRERLPNMEGTCFGSPVSDGRSIFCADESGNIHVIAASEEFSYLAFNRLGEPCKTTPAIAGGRLYIRTETSLRCIAP